MWYTEFCARVPGAGQYLKEVGFSNWARAFYARNRYNITTTNNSECLNSVFKYPRDLPLTALVDAILETVGTWFVKHRKKSGEQGKVVSDWVGNAIRANFVQSLSMGVRQLSAHEYEVRKGTSTWLVNLVGRLCSCRRFNVDQYPCAHAMAASIARDGCVLARQRLVQGRRVACVLQGRDLPSPVARELEGARGNRQGDLPPPTYQGTPWQAEDI